MNYYELPTRIELDGQSFTIRNDGDFRMVLDCFSVLNDYSISKIERIYTCLIIFYNLDDLEDVVLLGDIEKATTEMFSFFNMYQEAGLRTKQKLMDWEKDAQLVFSSVNTVAGKDVRSEKYMHWFTFMGFYMNIGEGIFSTIIGIRHKLVTGKHLEKYEQTFRNENPQYFNWNSMTEEQMEADKYIKEVWKGGKR